MNVRDIGPAAYTDLGGLAALRRGTNASSADGVREAARQFESLFARMLLSSMRAASPGDPLLDSNASGFYREMFDDQLAVELTRGHGLGLAEMLVEQLVRSGAVQGSGAQASAANDEPSAVRSVAGTPLPEEGSGPRDFVERFLPLAQVAAQRLGVAPEAVIAHAALETGWGRHAPARADGGPSFNLFGVKATGGWRGAEVAARTVEFEDGERRQPIERFRAYGSAEAAIDDYVRVVGGNPRYAAARGKGADTSGFAQALQAGGYATDPDYARKLEAVAVMVRQILDRDLKGGTGLPIQTLRSEA